MTDYTTAAEFSIRYLQFINEEHQLSQPLPEFADNDTLLKLYRQMSLTRVFDNKAINLQRTGKMGTYPPSLGQEAVGVGVGFAMQKQDALFPGYRDQGPLLQRGLTPAKFMSVWGGDERGNLYFEGSEDFPFCVPIATQCLHAAGAAYAFKYRNQPRVAVTTLGDGGTSKGDFYEAMNLAGAWNLPVVFVVNNNQWAISVPRSKQSHCETLAQKGIAAGIYSIQVDGNDIVAVVHAMHEALERARSGKGPSLIEAVTYRLCDHTTADDAKRYQPHNEVKEAWKHEPIARLGYYLEEQGLWSKDQEAKLQQEHSAMIEQAVADYLAIPLQPPTAMMDYLYAELPEALLDQYDEIRGLK